VTRPESPGSEPIHLQCLAGQPASPEVIADARRLLALPEGARQRLWQVLAPSLAEPIPPEVAPLYERFVKEHGVDGGALARALKVARLLVRQASALDLEPEQFADDLEKLGGGSRAIADALVPGYPRARQRVRAEILSGAVADHGRVLESFRWRVDMLASSDRGLGLKLPVVMLTLHYREGERREQISLQVLPHLLGQLRAVCDHVLGKR
jgi:hypothetical protein